MKSSKRRQKYCFSKNLEKNKFTITTAEHLVWRLIAVLFVVLPNYLVVRANVSPGCHDKKSIITFFANELFATKGFAGSRKAAVS